jgi:hypothetical protein
MTANAGQRGPTKATTTTYKGGRKLRGRNARKAKATALGICPLTLLRPAVRAQTAPKAPRTITTTDWCIFCFLT